MINLNLVINNGVLFVKPLKELRVVPIDYNK